MDFGNNIFRILIEIFHEIKKIFNDFLNLIYLEAELARRSLIRIIYSSLLLLILVITIWVLGMCMLAIWLHSIGWLWWLPFVIIMACHSVVALMTIFVIWRSIPNLSFPTTRKQLLAMRGDYEKKDHQTTEK